MNAGVGNLIAEGDKNRIWGVFRELFTSRFLIISTACYCMYSLSSAFITLWVGEQYVLDRISVLFIVLLFYILTSRVVVESYINAYGLFGDVWAPFAEAVINVGSSIALGRFWGLPGILGGILLSQVLIILLWKPYMLFRKGLKRPVREYVLLYGKHLVLFAISILPVSWMMGHLSLDPARNYLSFFLTGGLMEGSLLLVLGLLLYVFEPGMREFSARLLSIFSKR
jgi:O-antigen/teichoic acid export membrane protein